MGVGLLVNCLSLSGLKSQLGCYYCKDILSSCNLIEGATEHSAVAMDNLIHNCRDSVSIRVGSRQLPASRARPNLPLLIWWIL